MYLSNNESIPAKEIEESQSTSAAEPATTETGSVQNLAAATFDAFHPYINIHDCGKKLWDDKAGKSVPKHLITQEAYSFATVWQKLSKQQRKTYKPVFEKGRRKGTPFHYWGHYLNRVLSTDKIVEHINGEETYYSTGSRRRRALPYFDIDAHNGQEDELEAKRLLQDICGCSLWNPSDRGQNGYIKVNYGPVRNPDLSHSSFRDLSADATIGLKERISNGLSAKQINELFDRAQQVYGRYLKFHNIACTFEIKGKVTEYTTNPLDGTRFIKSGSLAKLPFTGWSCERLEEFKNLKEVRWFVWERQLQLLEQMLDDKESSTTVAVEPVQAAPADQTADCEVAKSSRKLKRTNNDSESCAFTRNRKDCLPFVRNFFRKHGHVPTHDDFLNHLKLNKLYSGEWDDPESDRFSRTARILSYTLQGFDSDLLGRGEGRWGDIPVLNWLRDYARDHFGSMSGTVIKGKDTLIFTADGVESGRRIQHCNVPAAFSRHCVWVILTCMEDLADNDGLPEYRIEKAWSLLPGAPAWNRDYYAIVRYQLEKRGVVDIYDKNHGPNKCWRWRKGKNYPYSPEQLKKKLKGITSCRTGSVLSVQSYCSTFKITPYCKVVGLKRSSWLSFGQRERPPPRQPLGARRNRRNTPSSMHFPYGTVETVCRDMWRAQSHCCKF